MEVNKKKQLFGMFLRMCGVIVASVLAGILLLTAVFALPVSAMQENLARSAQILSEEGAYHRLYEFCTSNLDNWTDATMLLIASHEGEGTVLERAMTGARDLLNSNQPVNSLAAKYLEGAELDRTVGYARYWHGYLLALKPLLLVMDYGGIRVLNLVIQLMLDCAILILMYKRGMKKLILPYLLTLGFLMPVALGKSMQFSTCFYAFSLSVLVLLLFKDKWDVRKSCFLFLGIGIFTAFVDFLTYPVAAFGIPAAVWFMMRPTESVKEGLKRLLDILFSWGLGYGGMWAGKWVAASILTEHNVIREALSAVLMRVSHDSLSGDNDLSALAAIWKNMKAFLKTPVTAVAFFFVLVLLILIAYRFLRGGRTGLGFVLPFCVLVLLPFLWYTATVNHSFIHYFFTNKSLAVTAFAGLCLLTRVWEQLKSE